MDLAEELVEDFEQFRRGGFQGRADSTDPGAKTKRACFGSQAQATSAHSPLSGQRTGTGSVPSASRCLNLERQGLVAEAGVANRLGFPNQ